nr:putative retrotransposon Gag domain, aspartic peptidase domain protein [Tanacetum cinerariifolium]
ALLDGVVQDHRDGLELLHEFSSLNRRANEEGERTIGALSSALYMAWASLDKATKRMKKWTDERRRRVSYRVQLPPKLKIHPVFHVSFLKPYHGDEEDPERGVSKRAPTAVVTSYDQEVEEILSDRTIRRRGVPSYKEYLIKWHDLPDSEASWEAEDLLWQFADEIKRYHEDSTTRIRLSGILWKVDEGLGSPWNVLESFNTLSGDLKREIHDLRDSFMGEIAKIREEFGEEVSTLHQTIEDLQADMALCKRSLASRGGNANQGSKLDVPKPSPFMGKRKARAVDDFLWEMEQYLEGVNVVDDASKIKMATRYLKDTAALWWRRRHGDIERGTATIDTWAGFVADFNKQFYPENAKNEAKSRLRKLKQSGTIRE